MEQPTHDLKDMVGILRRRKLPMLLVGLAIASAGVAVAFVLPPSYRSTATILIEEQEIPSDIVRSAITSYADQRIETIKQQIMTRSTLWKIVEQYGLYASLRRDSPTEEVLARFTKDIRVDVINAKVIDKRTQNATQATIAFTLTYDGESPDIAQKVANELTSLFLGENLKTRERHAQETTAFLKKESETLARQIGALELQLSAIKQKADGALPELTSLNMTMLNQAERELQDADREIRALEEKKAYLEGELATLKPHTPIIAAGGERILDSAERLKALRAQYASAIGYLSAEHPDVLKMQQEIAALERETGRHAAPEELHKKLSGERAELAGLVDRYGDEHPDVIRSRRIVASLEQELERVLAAGTQARTIKPENPAYINIRAQLSSTTASLQSLRKSREGIKRRVEEFAGRLERTIEIEPTYLDLSRNREESVRKHQEIMSRLLEAEVSKELEIQRKGERFSLIDPPDLPEKPDKPNRPVIMFLGLILAVAGGIGSGTVLEQLDRSIRGAAQLGRLAGLPPLAVIPYMPNEDDVRRMVRRRVRFAAAGAGVLVVSLIVVLVLGYPLDVVWFAALRKLGLS
ncbi:Wzz/FepE/Etk N-terminal domain-containing protein [Nitrospira moscoviensis]|uniref:Putative Lipopolysaccharide biosynthesis protein n=1 Tax=Nitrospira moscoviensis TaxID=42253 RepID=A0A0K2GJL8_NITMO|nr:Wzz/FepE/Etk N-terminal domain-containing protein [Nitrospira moscoviensis]ALA61131.1 putative Lipopolysaccharide biosynthesis protein [Nitrospira moscoviensis]